MDLDLSTLLAACALAIATVSAVFTTTAALRHNDEANRAWVAGFSGAMSLTGLAAIYGVDASTPTIVLSMIDLSSVFAVGALWVGARHLDGRRRSWLWLVLVAALAVTAPTVLGGDQPDLDVSSAVRLVVTGVLAWLGAIELMRGPMGPNLNCRILQGALFIVGGWFVAAAALFAAADGGGTGRPSLESTILPFTALFVVAAICLSAIRVERTGNWWSVSAERRQSDLSVLAAEPFRGDARDRLQRAAMTGRHVGLVLAEISELDELNAAFGREAGDGALVHFAELLRAYVPATALIGYLGAGRFAVLTVSTTPDAPAKVVASIRTGLVDAALTEDMEIRTDASFGSSDTVSATTTFERLLAEAVADLDRSRSVEN